MPRKNWLYEELMRRYHERLQSNPNAHEEILEILEEMRPIHKDDATKRGVNVDQSWRSWKGNNFEKFLRDVLTASIEARLPFKVISGSDIEKKVVDEELSLVKRNLLVDFGIHGNVVPDADIVVYSPDDRSVKAIISCKVSLRERIAQTGYWKLKLQENPVTRNILMYFATPDGDKDFLKERPPKGIVIAMYELDAVYVLSDEVTEEHNIRRLGRIIEDLNNAFR